MFKVLVRFKDLKDNAFVYNAGDTYPRAGYKPSAERIKELSSKNNKRGKALIAEILEEPKEEVEEKKATKKKKVKE